MSALTLHSDTSAVGEITSELSSLIEAGKVPLEVAHRLVGAIEAGAEAFVIKADRLSTAGADKLVVRAEPSDALLRFMAAARAGNADLGAVEDALRHIETSRVEGGDDASPNAASPSGAAQ
ncbi:MAG: hypothetical protein H0W39_01165 [Sphingomonas sp.]|nr:hypothetical protein [Sphingomonas sp.]